MEDQPTEVNRSYAEYIYYDPIVGSNEECVEPNRILLHKNILKTSLTKPKISACDFHRIRDCSICNRRRQQ
jgi:hypothetical protein